MHTKHQLSRSVVIPAMEQLTKSPQSPPHKRARALRKENSADASLILSASSRVTEAFNVVEGTLLPTLAKENLQGFKAVLPPSHPLALGFVGGEQTRAMDDLDFTWGSCCSGSEGVHYVVEACGQPVAEIDLPVTFQHAFSCESNKAKRSWIADVLCKGKIFNSDLHETFAHFAEVGCIFEDIKDMGSEMSKCSLHGKECPVPSVDCLFIGTSCKDLSRANSSVDKSTLVLSQESSKGASAQTFRGMLNYCRGHRPTLVLFENVDAIDDKASSSTETNLSLLMSAMKDLGYEGQKIMTDCQEFGLPCRRRRLYVMFIDKESRKVDTAAKPLSQIFSTLRTLVTSCMRSPPCSKECLLSPSDPDHLELLEKALECHQRSAQKAAEKKAPPQTWIDKHMAYADDLGYRWGSAADEELAGNKWYQTLSKREADALVLSRVADPTCEFRNVSQSVGRINSASQMEYKGKEVAPTMLPGQLMWVESQQRILTGYEALIYQGFPIQLYLAKARSLPEPCKSQGFLTDIAGNAMAFPVVLAIFQATLASVPWLPACEDEDDSQDDGDEKQEEAAADVETALAALAYLQR